MGDNYLSITVLALVNNKQRFNKETKVKSCTHVKSCVMAKIERDKIKATQNC